MHELERVYNYRYVDESLATSGQPSVSELQSIASAGFATVINLALHDDPRYSLPDEPGLVAALGMKYVHIPVQFTSPTQQTLAAFELTTHQAHGGPTTTSLIWTTGDTSV